MADGIAAWFDKYPDPATTPSYDAAAERLLSTVLAMPSSPTLARPGVRPGGSPVITVDGTAMTVTVGPHSGIITDPAGGGSFLYVIPAAVTKSLATRPGGGTSRIDEVVVVIKNDEVRPADGAREVDIAVITGAAGASPAAPSVPTGQLRLNELAVPSSGGISLSKPAQRTAALGGTLNLTSQAEEDALTGALVWDGMTIYREDTDQHKVRQNGAWVVLAVDYGWQDLTLTGVDADWTIGAARYRQVGPVVYLDISVTRAGATLTGDAQGNIVEDPISTGGIPAGILPASTMTILGARRTSYVIGFNIDTAGALNLSFAAPGAVIASGANLRLLASYPLG